MSEKHKMEESQFCNFPVRQNKSQTIIKEESTFLLIKEMMQNKYMTITEVLST